ncbi:MAG: hypothetical protein L0177_13820 [Chloroflexi bacterium]|nr:hypothetical protein [Chloroflexota bacterium]
MDAKIKDELIQQLDALPYESQRRVLDFAKALAMSTPRGATGKDLIRFAGAISEDDLRKMAEAIDDDFEQAAEYVFDKNAELYKRLAQSDAADLL